MYTYKKKGFLGGRELLFLRCGWQIVQPKNYANEGI